MHGAVSVILKKAFKAHQCVAACAYSLRYGRSDYNPNASESASEMLTLWKSAVLPHFTLYLRYLPLASQIHSLQKQLNSSLRRSLRVYGHDTALLADTGILLLRLVQHIQLSQLCFRLNRVHSPPEGAVIDLLVRSRLVLPGLASIFSELASAVSRRSIQNASASTQTRRLLTENFWTIDIAVVMSLTRDPTGWHSGDQSEPRNLAVAHPGMYDERNRVVVVRGKDVVL